MTAFQYSPILPKKPPRLRMGTFDGGLCGKRQSGRHRIPPHQPRRIKFSSRIRFQRNLTISSAPLTWHNWAEILKDDEASPNDHFVALEMTKKRRHRRRPRVAYVPRHPAPPSSTASAATAFWWKAMMARHFQKACGKSIKPATYAIRKPPRLPCLMRSIPILILPAQIDLYAGKGMEYHFDFIQKGGGSANKSFLFQKTKALLNPESLTAFIDETLRTLGTAACPPYHLAVVIGGTSAESQFETVKAASIRALDHLPTKGDGKAAAIVIWNGKPSSLKSAAN